MDITEVRSKIDDLDQRMLNLFLERMSRRFGRKTLKSTVSTDMVDSSRRKKSVSAMPPPL